MRIFKTIRKLILMFLGFSFLLFNTILSVVGAAVFENVFEINIYLPYFVLFMNLLLIILIFTCGLRRAGK